MVILLLRIFIIKIRERDIYIYMYKYIYDNKNTSNTKPAHIEKNILDFQTIVGSIRDTNDE